MFQISWVSCKSSQFSWRNLFQFIHIVCPLFFILDFSPVSWTLCPIQTKLLSHYLCHFCISANQCTSPPVETHACGRYRIHDDEEEHFQLESAATTFCNKLLQNPSFAACRTVSTYAETWFVIQTYLDGLKQNMLCPAYTFFSKLSLKSRKIVIWYGTQYF
jgi:hypothetical protein